jgi:transcription elongation GreA/GreB family factor
MSNPPDKKQIYAIILDALEALVANARNAMLVAYETATHEENIAENKYDTLGLEAAYLTQGQARRLAECEADQVAFRNYGLRLFGEDDVIAVGALVELEDEAGNHHFLLLGPAAGGLKVVVNEQEILVITPSAPLGKAMLNAAVGDSVSVHVAAHQKRYDIVALY